MNWYQLAPLYLELRDIEGYRRVCREMLKRFGDTDQLEIAERTAKTCLLIPNSGIELGLPVKLAERAANRSFGQANAKWFHLVKGIADYRQGQFAGALEWLGRSVSPGSEVVYLDSTAYLFLALAHKRLGHDEDAKQALYKARFLMDERFPKLGGGQSLGANWADWLRFQIVRREAESLIKTPAAVSQK